MDLKDTELAQRKLAAAYKEILADATIEDRLDGLTPEQRFLGLTPEQIAAALPLEALELIARKMKS
jgi:hypothetical protein